MRHAVDTVHLTTVEERKGLLYVGRFPAYPTCTLKDNWPSVKITVHPRSLGKLLSVEWGGYQGETRNLPQMQNLRGFKKTL